MHIIQRESHSWSAARFVSVYVCLSVVYTPLAGINHLMAFNFRDSLIVFGAFGQVKIAVGAGDWVAAPCRFEL